MRFLRCVVTLAFVIAAAPAWAADISPVAPLAGPNVAFRTPGGEAQPGAGNESGSSSPLAGSAPSLTPGGMPGPWLVGGAQVAMNDVAPMQMAQAIGSVGAAPLAAPAANPWIFGTTLYLWVPFSDSTSKVAGLPPENNHKLFNTDTHITNLIGGAGDFQLSKGDWGLFANIAGVTVGYKGTILQEDSRFPLRQDRSGYSHSSVVGGQYGLSYRLLGRPLDLTTWARGTQPISLDLLAGAQTLYFSASVNTQRVQAAADATLTSPLVGTRLSWDMADRWNLGLGGNIGGFGVSDTNLTWQVDLTVAYRFLMGSVPGAVSLGFRVKGLNIETGSNANNLKVDEILYGPTLGFSLFF